MLSNMQWQKERNRNGIEFILRELSHFIEYHISWCSLSCIVQMLRKGFLHCRFFLKAVGERGRKREMSLLPKEGCFESQYCFPGKKLSCFTGVGELAGLLQS